MRARRIFAGRAAAGLLALLALAVPARAEDKPASGKELLKLYYTVAIAADRCGWPIAPAEIAALDKAAAAAQEDAKLDEPAADAFFNELDAAFAREKNQRCVSGGETEALYKKTLAEIVR